MTVDLADDPHRQKRMAAEIEEIVPDADTIEMQRVAPDFCENDFGWRARCDHFVIRGVMRRFGRRQRLAVEFAVRREWKCIDGDESGRDHVGRQGFAQQRAQLAPGDPGAGGGYVVGNETVAAIRIILGNDHALADAVVMLQGGFDFTQFDAMPAYFDLVVDAAHELERAIG